MESSAISNLGGGQQRFWTRLAILGVGFGPCMDANERGQNELRNCLTLQRTGFGAPSLAALVGTDADQRQRGA